MYIIKKYIMATNAIQAIKKDQTTAVHDCWVDDDWKTKNLAGAIGFTVDFPEPEEI